MALHLESFQNALQRLEEGLSILAGDPQNSMLRDAVIKRFEFTYEVTHKTLRRYLMDSSAQPDTVAGMSFAALIRTANERGLLRSDWKRWHGFRDARNRSSHLYDQHAADEVLAQVPDFLAEARDLCSRLKEKLAHGEDAPASRS